MKTPRAQGTGHDVGKAEDAAQARRKRTLTAIACESLEGKRLMTGFAGAAAMAGGMSGGPAEMGDLGGFEHRREGLDRLDGTQDQGDAASGGSGADQANFSIPGTMQDGGMRSSLRRADDRGPSGSFGGDHHDLAGRDFGGPGTSGDQGATSTGNAQLDADFKKLRTDEQAIHDKSQVTPALQAAVRKDMEAIDAAKTGTADATKLQALQDDQKATFVAGSRPTDDQLAKLQADQDAVWLSQGVSQSLIDQLAADRLAVKTASNFTADDQATLDADHAAIKTDMAAAQSAPTASDASTAPAAPATPIGASADAPATPATPVDASTTAAAATPTVPTGASTAASTASGAVVNQETAGPTGGTIATPAPGSSTPMVLATPTVGSTNSTGAVAAPAAPTGQSANGSARAGGPHGGMGFGRHAGSGFSSHSRGPGGFGGGRSSRAPRR